MQRSVMIVCYMECGEQRGYFKDAAGYGSQDGGYAEKH